MHIPPKNIRSHIIKIRVNLDEKTLIKNRAGSTATAEWLRQLALDIPADLTKRRSRHTARIYLKNIERSLLVCEIARIGNNLNQLTRCVNAAKYSATPIDLVTVSSQLNLIWQELQNVQQNF